MNSYDVQDHGDTDRINGQAKKPWITPSLQVIALKSAESGSHLSRKDGGGGKFNRPYS
jgi:hypothetical protein